jgi:hypothetical protein
MKEAVLDFAQRHQLPSPSWWVDSPPGTSPEVPNNAGNTVTARISAAASPLVGKQHRIVKYLSEHFPDGVREPGLCPRDELKADIIKWDRRLGPLDEATLKKGIDSYNARLTRQKIDPN